MRKILLIFLYLSLLIPSHTINGEELTIGLLDRLIAEAVSNNPKIQSAYYKWQAAKEKAPQVSSLPDPMAGVTIPGEKIQTRLGPQENKYSVSQTIPFPSKLSTRAKAALKHAEVMRERYEAVKLDIIKDTKYVYYDIYWTDRAILVVEQEKDILDNLTKVARRKYEANLSNQHDLVKAEVELSRLIDKLYVLRQRRKSLVSNMNSLLNRSRDAEIEQIPELDITQYEYSLEYLKELAENNRQELIEALLQIEKAKYEKSLAKLDYVPDFTLGFDYIVIGSGETTNFDDGQDAWMGSVKINVPIWYGSLHAKIKEKENLLEAKKKEYRDVQNKVAFEIEDLFFKINAYFDIVELYRTALIPQTEQAFRGAATGYETGSVDFLDWLDSERILLQTRLAYYKAILDYKKSIAFMERVVGILPEGNND